MQDMEHNIMFKVWEPINSYIDDSQMVEILVHRVQRPLPLLLKELNTSRSKCS